MSREYRQRYAASRKEMGLPLTNNTSPEVTKKRQDMALALPGNFHYRHLNAILPLYGNECPLTHRMDKLHVDHFIPTAWGHGGSYEGNLVPMYQTLNVGKSNKNPFEWIQQEWVMDLVFDLSRWLQLVDRLAEQNGLSSEEFVLFVYWCERNPRTVDQVRMDPRRSVEIWSSLGRPQQLHDYSPERLIGLRQENWEFTRKATARQEAYMEYIQNHMPILFLCEVEAAIQPPEKGEPGSYMFRQIRDLLPWGYTFGRKPRRLLKEWASRLGMDSKAFILAIRRECRLSGKKGELLAPSIKDFMRNLKYRK